jgi:hypothetical protein
MLTKGFYTRLPLNMITCIEMGGGNTYIYGQKTTFAALFLTSLQLSFMRVTPMTSASPLIHFFWPFSTVSFVDDLPVVIYRS